MGSSASVWVLKVAIFLGGPCLWACVAALAGLGEPQLYPGRGGLSGHQVSQTTARDSHRRRSEAVSSHV
jgi:hypothetical protein